MTQYLSQASVQVSYKTCCYQFYCWKIHQKMCKCKIFLMAVCMIFKYSKRFRFAPSFNNKRVNLISQNLWKEGPIFFIILCKNSISSNWNWPIKSSNLGQLRRIRLMTVPTYTNFLQFIKNRIQIVFCMKVELLWTSISNHSWKGCRKIFLGVSSTSQGPQKGPNSALRNSFFMCHLISLWLVRTCKFTSHYKP